MPDIGPRVVANYQSLPNNPSPHNHYLAQAPDNSYSRRKPPLASLALYDLPGAGMASSASPPDAARNEFGGVGTGLAYGAPPSAVLPPGGDPNGALNLNLIKNLSDKRTRDGQPAKRRGPKPDSKPALTRRQELNRQAQRTHRERKELYIKALEDEVLRLKEVYSTVKQDRDRLEQENQMLQGIIQQQNLNLPPPHARSAIMTDDLISNQPYMGQDNHSPSSASYALNSATSNTSPFSPLSTANGAMPRGLSPGGLSPSGYSPRSALPVGLHRPSPSTQHAPQQRNPGIDYDQAGVAFVLALERPCMDHMPWLLERSAANGGKDPCGHALMASCPPEPYSELAPDVPFGHRHGGGGGGVHPVQHQHQHQHQHRHQHTPGGGGGGGAAAPAVLPSAMDVDPDDGAPRTWELSKSGLSTLLDLSKKLNLDGEITPVMAWGMVLGHPRLGELSEKDFTTLSEELTSKVRCYGFGAVMEEFEVRDALAAMFSRKPEPSF